MKRFYVTYKNMRNGRACNKTNPINFYGTSEEEVRKHFDTKGYKIVSIRECHSLV